MYICIGTTLSIVRPVRRLLAATHRIAKGDAEARVPRGGIKELDTLAVAFNDMANELAAAKAAAGNYQQQLENRVAERTLQLQQLAEHDPLTGLPNRRQLFPLLAEAIEQAEAADKIVGVFFIDIDNFKYMNDSLGHAYGDRVLVTVANRLEATAREFGFSRDWAAMSSRWYSNPPPNPSRSARRACRWCRPSRNLCRSTGATSISA
jgi:HAMP domain-containing protein